MPIEPGLKTQFYFKLSIETLTVPLVNFVKIFEANIKYRMSKVMGSLH